VGDDTVQRHALASPIVVNGHIYVVDGVSPTAESQLWVYELDGVFNGKID